jgi:hypothetical protein
MGPLIYPPTSIDRGVCTQCEFVGKIFPTNYLCGVFFPTPPRHTKSWAFWRTPEGLGEKKIDFLLGAYGVHGGSTGAGIAVGEFYGGNRRILGGPTHWDFLSGTTHFPLVPNLGACFSSTGGRLAFREETTMNYFRPL